MIFDMATKKEYYSYALDENSHLIEINDAAKGFEYRCPNCDAIMIPRQGEIRRWHFAHKANVENCSYETYLHKLAKMRIRECFNKSSSFFIAFNAHVACAVKECPVGRKQPCTWIDTKEFDLKQYYDHCEEEVAVGKFKADLLVYHSVKTNREPILIEIWVTHKSTEEKLNSEYHVIEILVESESEINQIISKASIKETRVDIFGNEYRVEGEPYIRFYKFRKKSTTEIPKEEHQSPKYLFWINSKGQFKFNNYREIDHMFWSAKSVKCLSPNHSEIENSIFSIASPHRIDWNFAFRKLVESGLGIKYCTMCRWYRKNKKYGRSICILYKSKGTKQYPGLLDAMRCPHFSQIDYKSYYEDLQLDYNQECKITINKSLINNLVNKN